MIVKIGFIVKEMKDGLGLANADDFTQADIVAIHKKEGDHIGEGDILFEFDTDKATTEFLSPISGDIVKICYSEGEKWQYGGTEDSPFGEIYIPHLLEIETDELQDGMSKAESAVEELPKEKQPEVKKPKKKGPALKAKMIVAMSTLGLRFGDLDEADLAVLSGREDVDNQAVQAIFKKYAKQETVEATTDIIPAVPKARAFAEENKIDLLHVKSSEDGVIYLEDVVAHKPHTEKSAPEATKKRIFDDGSEIITPSMIRLEIAELLSYSKRYIPDAGDEEVIDVTEIVNFRNRHNAFSEKIFGYKLRYDHFFMYFAAKHLMREEFRMLNNWWNMDTKEIHSMSHVNLGLAIDVGYGLMVPVIHAAEELTFRELVERTENIILRAKNKKLKRTDFLDLTVTVNNPGARGGRRPYIIVPSTRMKGVSGIRPTSLILAFARLERRGDRWIMLVVNRFDHRIEDAGAPLELLKRLKQWCEVESEEQLLAQLI